MTSTFPADETIDTGRTPAGTRLRLVRRAYSRASVKNAQRSHHPSHYFTVVHDDESSALVGHPGGSTRLVDRGTLTSSRRARDLLAWALRAEEELNG